jgi:glycosyltransferase involved in cell wall biosynthesis
MADSRSAGSGQDHQPVIVLHLLASAASGGGPTVVLNFISFSKCTNLVALPRDNEVNFAAFQGRAAEVIALDVRRLSVRTLMRIVSIIRARSVSVVHSHGLAAGLYGRIAALLTRRKSVHTFHGWRLVGGSRRRVKLWIERSLGSITQHAIAVSRSEYDALLADRVVAAPQLVHVPNAVMLPTAPAAARPDADSSVFNVVSLSRQSPQKDLLTLIRTASLLGPAFHFHVFGGVLGNELAYAEVVHSEIARLKVANVTLYGDVPGAAAQLRHFDAYLSTAAWEGLPTAIIESFLSEVPVVASSCAGNTDLVRDNDTGLLCPVGDPQAFANALIRLRDDPSLASRLRANAIQSAMAYSPAAVSACLDRLYYGCVRGGSESQRDGVAQR